MTAGGEAGMIIPSLLDTDLYKFTMMQVVLHHFPGAQVEYRFKCRNSDVDLTPYVGEIRDEVRQLCALKFTPDELAYLRGWRFFKSDFVDLLSLFELDERFFDLFAKVATINVEAARALGELFATADAARRAALVDQIKRLEHDADELTHAVVARLDRSFITPLDREDIHLLASRLDDVIDLIDGIARRSQIFRIGEAPRGAILLAEVIQRAAAELLTAVRVMDRGKGMTVFDSCREVKRLEEEGDALYHEWLGRLFDDGGDPVNVIKWKELYDTLERTLDSAEDVANVLESVSIKHG